MTLRRHCFDVGRTVQRLRRCPQHRRGTSWRLRLLGWWIKDIFDSWCGLSSVGMIMAHHNRSVLDDIDTRQAQRILAIVGWMLARRQRRRTDIESALGTGNESRICWAVNFLLISCIGMSYNDSSKIFGPIPVLFRPVLSEAGLYPASFIFFWACYNSDERWL